MKKYNLIRFILLIALCFNIKVYSQSNKTNETIDAVNKTVETVKGIFKKKKDGKTQTAAEIEADASKMDQNLVIKTIFGNIKPNTQNEILWRYSSGVKLGFEEEQLLSSDGQFHTTLKQIMYFTDNNVQAALAVFITYKYSITDGNKLQKEECSVCTQPVWGIATYTKQPDNTWKLFNKKLLFQTVASLMGIETEFQQVNLGPNLDALVVTSSYRDDYGFSQSVSYTGINNVYFLNNVFNYDLVSENITKIPTLVQTEDSPFKTILLKSEKNGKTTGKETYTFNVEEGKYIKKAATKIKSVKAKVTSTKKTAVAGKTPEKKLAENTPPKPVKTQGNIKRTAVKTME